MYDLLIKNATVIDGTGEPSFVADVGVKEGRVVDVAQGMPVRAREEVEAEGLVLAPGFVDVQNHSDSYWCLFDSPGLDSMVLQGYTSVLVGNCGTSLAPLLSGDAYRSSQKWHDQTGNNFNWTSFAEFAETLRTRKLGSNVGSLVGYSTLRRGLLGDEQRSLTPEETLVLSRALEDSLNAGAFGLSTGLAYAHEAQVSMLELYELARIIADKKALLSVHVRDEAGGIAESVEEALEICQRSGVRLKFSHFKVRGKGHWPVLPEVLERLEEVTRQGSDVSFDLYPYDTTWQPLYTYLPKWATAGGRSAMLAHLANPTQYKKILAHLHNAESAVRDLVVASTSYHMQLVSKNFGQIAETLGMTSEEAVLEVLRNGGTEVLVFDRCLSDGQVDELLAHPLSVVASDGGGFALHPTGRHPSKLLHPRCVGTSANFLARVRKTKRISLEAAIAKLTGLPARTWGLAERGRIEIGYAADLVLFDPHAIADLATIENPYRSPAGIHAVWVNGALAASNGELAQSRSGVFLRKQ